MVDEFFGRSAYYDRNKTEYRRVPFLQPSSLNTMLFPTERHHGHDVVLETPSATLQLPYSQSKSSRSIPMPWVIPPWLVLVECLGLTAKEHDKHDDNEVMTFTTMLTTATATSSMSTTRMAMMATMTTVKGTATVMTMTTTTAMTTMISTMTMTMTLR